MGCDGGTIPRRDELVKVKKKPEEVSHVAALILSKPPKQSNYSVSER